MPMLEHHECSRGKRIALALWIVFSVLYIGYNEYGRLNNFVYQKGIADAVVKVMEEASKCKPVPLVAGDQKMDILAVACLQGKAPAGAANGAAAAPKPTN